MQDRFAGDFGDYVKLALLKHLGEGRRLNVCWFRTPDLITGNDGRHTEYLRPDAEARWRPFDPATYDQLRSMVESGKRSIQQLTFALAAPGVEFFDFELSTKAYRSVWFAELSAWSGQADLLFLDPDNGVAAAGSTGGTASVTQQEVTHLLRSTATLIVYHHQTRAKGGHLAELENIAIRLMPAHHHRAVCALRAPGWSPRAFFILSPDQNTWARAQAFAEKWSPHVTFHALTDAPDQLGFTPGVSAYRRVEVLEASDALDRMADQYRPNISRREADGHSSSSPHEIR